MQTWAQRLSDTQTKRGWARIFGDPERSRTGLAMLHALLAGKRYSGPGALRPLYAQFLQEVTMTGEGASDVELPALADAAARYQGLGARWDALTELIGAAGEPDFAAMARQMEAIAEGEGAAAQVLWSAAGGKL
jgi:hypothetical protein